MGKGLPKSYIKKYGITKKAWRMYKGKKKPKSGKSKSKSKKRTRKRSRGGKPRKMAKRGIGIPSAASLGQMATVLLYLNTHNEVGEPLHEFMAGNAEGGIKALLTNAKNMIATPDGWLKVILPVAGIQMVKKVLPRVRVNVFGINWSLI